jgi:isoamylase
MTAVLEPTHQIALPGSVYPLGATLMEDGVNFSVASSVADWVTLCLFDEEGRETQVRLPDYDYGAWHGFVPGFGAGQAYGFRVHGPYDPDRGLRCNPAKLLLDPYAREIRGTVTSGPVLHDGGEEPSDLDSAPNMPRSIVINPKFDWDGDELLRHRYSDSVIYEVHVRGFTKLHPDIPEHLRGTYAGLAHEAAIKHLTDLGVTAVELLPVHQYVPEDFLTCRGLTNYWGYNTIGYFAPHNGYAATDSPIDEFKAMVKALHTAGLEVILDVVFNHTAEGGDGGPTLCFRGLDNPGYYRLVDGNPRQYYDTTGCGNSLNVGDPVTLQLIMDSLRYWITEMHVDGFRFDLASTLARADGGFSRVSAFFALVAQDPVVSQVKLIAEPWDVGQMDSYDLGDFPPLWREWNGQYRDSMRDFWRGRHVGIGEFATRFSGSSDLYGHEKRRPTASVNILTVHDGFTLRDLVSYDNKHNEANGEDNTDGATDNRSWNCGVEGVTSDKEVNALRSRQQRAMLTTLLLSFGVPLILGGDEFGRAQGGNNNAYCQDNEISWFDWSSPDKDLEDFTRQLIAFRLAHPVFRRRKFLCGADAAELAWFSPSGAPMNDSDWDNKSAMALGVYLDGWNDPDTTADGRPMLDDDFLVFINGWREPLGFTLPKVRNGQAWNAEIDTYDPSAAPSAAIVSAGDEVTVGPRSLLVLRGPRSRRRPHTRQAVAHPGRQAANPDRPAANPGRQAADRSPRSEGARGATEAAERGGVPSRSEKRGRETTRGGVQGRTTTARSGKQAAAKPRGEAQGGATARGGKQAAATARGRTRGRANAGSGRPEPTPNGGRRRATPPRTSRADKGSGS